jgi:PIN domain nuclease of toxin-antitoxin system
VTLLLDTHLWLWWTDASERLPKEAFQLIADPKNRICFSVVSSWEIAVKYRLGKLRLSMPPATYVPTRLAQQGFETLAISSAHALETGSLPDYHRDPFDRLLVAQAQVEGMTLLTADRALEPYAVRKILV